MELLSPIDNTLIWPLQKRKGCRSGRWTNYKIKKRLRNSEVDLSLAAPLCNCSGKFLLGHQRRGKCETWFGKMLIIFSRWSQITIYCKERWFFHDESWCAINKLGAVIESKLKIKYLFAWCVHTILLGRYIPLINPPHSIQQDNIYNRLRAVLAFI